MSSGAREYLVAPRRAERRDGLSVLYPEIETVFQAKIMLCFILDRFDRPLPEELLYEIVQDSEVINYFFYAEALNGLIESGAVSKDGGLIVLNEKGRFGSEYFNSNIPDYFRRKLLKSADSLLAKIARESEADIAIDVVPNGFEVSCVIKDVSYDLMRLSVYAPGKEQAELIKSNILKNPALFYKNVIEYIFGNEEV
jgi:hypothetical protein